GVNTWSPCPRMRASGTSGNLDQPLKPRRTGSSAFADDDTVFWVYCRYFAGVATIPPVGAAASAVLVDFTACGLIAASPALPTNRSCTGLGASSATGTMATSSFGSTSATASV